MRMKFEISFAGKRVTAHIHHHARDALVLRSSTTSPLESPTESALPLRRRRAATMSGEKNESYFGPCLQIFKTPIRDRW